MKNQNRIRFCILFYLTYSLKNVRTYALIRVNMCALFILTYTPKQLNAFLF